MTLGEKIHCLRKEKGLSQEELASQITVSRQAVSKWELDQAIPDSENLVQLSQLLDVSLDYLLKEDVNQKEVAKKEIMIGKNFPLILVLILIVSVFVASLFDMTATAVGFASIIIVIVFIYYALKIMIKIGK